MIRLRPRAVSERVTANTQHPSLIGVIHLPPLTGSPRAPSDATTRAIEQALSDTKLLVDTGYELVVLENFGDAPFFKEIVPAVTVAAMTAVAAHVRRDFPKIAIGINVLRNDANSALSIASVVGASMIRVNVHTGARVADQGIIEGHAAETLRLRKELGSNVAIWADVDVKHSAALAKRPIEEEAKETFERGAADALIVTGSGTGAKTAHEDLEAVRRAVPMAPLYVGSGAEAGEHLRATLSVATGIIVGTAIKVDGKPGGAVDRARAEKFSAAFFAARPSR